MNDMPRKFDPIDVLPSGEADNGYLTQDQVDDLEFPNLSKERSELRDRSAGQLIAEITALQKQIGNSIKTDYAGRNRRIYLAAQIRLNELSVEREKNAPAPAFRPHLTAAWTPKEQEKVLSNDTQVIDLHYLHLLGHRQCAGMHGNAAMSGCTLEFDEALRFAVTAGATARKRGQLFLNDDKPELRLKFFGLQILKTNDDRMLQRSAIRHLASHKTALDATATAPGSNKDLWAALLTAENLLEEMELEVKNGTLADAVAILTGEPVGPINRLTNKLASAKKARGR